MGNIRAKRASQHIESNRARIASETLNVISSSRSNNKSNGQTSKGNTTLLLAKQSQCGDFTSSMNHMITWKASSKLKS